MGKLFKILTASLVVLSFCSVWQLSAVASPCRDDNEKAPSDSIEKADDSPQIGAEKEATAPTVKKKRSALPWVLGGLGVVGIAILLLSKKSNSKDKDSTLWDFVFHPRNEYGALGDTSLVFKFTGSASSGSIAAYNSNNVFINGSGSYEIVSDSVSIRWKSFTGGNTIDKLVLSGKVIDSNTYGGTILEGIFVSRARIFDISGTWDARKK
ncbi:MAG TPA: hypothetical protein PKK12_02980 [Candidatus Aminicenantes bacterium]|nr:hypothetical protein [Candidatus Aminicenantes bacterium]